MSGSNKTVRAWQGIYMKDMYTHGGFIEGDIGEYLDFSANIAPFGMPAGVRAAAEAAIAEAERYPDPFCKELIRALSQKTGLCADNIAVGNGACDLIYRTVQACFGICCLCDGGKNKSGISGRKAIIIEPAFSEYERALKLFGVEVIHYHAGSVTKCLSRKGREGIPDRPDLSELSEEIGHDRIGNIGLIFIANPSNPEGRLFDREELVGLAKICGKKGIILVADECFMGFVSDKTQYSLLPLIAKEQESFENVLVIDAFTKLYAMPGLRLGFLAGGSKALIERIDSLRQPWLISTPALKAGIAALELTEEEYRLPLADHLKKQRRIMKEALENLGFEVADGQANYLFFTGGIKDLKERLLKKKILIRDCSDYYGLSKGSYRTAVLTEEKNRRLLEAVSEAVKEV